MGKGQSIFISEMPTLLNIWRFPTVPKFALEVYKVASVDRSPSYFKQVKNNCYIYNSSWVSIFYRKARNVQHSKQRTTFWSPVDFNRKKKSSLSKFTKLLPYPLLNSTLKPTLAMMPTNLSHLALLRQMTNCFSAKLCAFYFFPHPPTSSTSHLAVWATWCIDLPNMLVVNFHGQGLSSVFFVFCFVFLGGGGGCLYSA